jgi:hypothetical protein
VPTLPMPKPHPCLGAGDAMSRAFPSPPMTNPSAAPEVARTRASAIPRTDGGMRERVLRDAVSRVQRLKRPGTSPWRVCLLREAGWCAR